MSMKTRRFKIGSVSVYADIEDGYAYVTATAGPAFTMRPDDTRQLERVQRRRSELLDKIAVKLKIPRSNIALEWQGRM